MTYFFSNMKKLNKKQIRSRKLRLESLENRELLSGDGLLATTATDSGCDPFVVTTTEDVVQEDGYISLREAIANAVAALSDSDESVTISFQTESSTIALNSELSIALPYASALTIDGSWQGEGVTIDAGDSSRIFNIDGTAGEQGLSVAIKNMTLQGGSADKGGAIYLALTDDQTFSVEGVSFNGNAAGNGGALYNATKAASALVTVSNSEFCENSATNSGGAIYSIGGSLKIEGAVFSENSAKFGGAYYGASDVFIDGAKFVNNTACSENFDGSGFSGGAIYNVYSAKYSSSVTIVDAYFGGNEASKYGGAISNFGTLSVSESVFEGNAATSGGAIQTSGSATIDGVGFIQNEALKRDYTIAENDFGGNGGAIFASNNASRDGFVCSLTIGGETTFTENNAENAGGAVDQIDGTLTFGLGDQDEVAAVFDSNVAAECGGALVAVGDMSAVDCSLNFHDNYAYKGGALYVDVPDGSNGVVLDNVIFSTNSAYKGGAIYNASKADSDSVCVNYGQFIENSARNSGGAVYSLGGAFEVGEGSSFTGNEAKFGGAYYGASDAAFTEVEFRENKAVNSNFTGTGYSGGAIYNAYSAKYPCVVTVTSSGFYDNAASKYGGAISNFGTLIVDSDVFEGNKASEGGAIQTAGTATIVGQTSFSHNKANQSGVDLGSGDFGGNGGAIYASNNAERGNFVATLVIDDKMTFYANEADNAGGAIDAIAGDLIFAEHADVNFEENCSVSMGGALVLTTQHLGVGGYLTFEGNASDKGGAVYVVAPGEVDGFAICNSVFTENSASKGGAIYNATKDQNAALGIGGEFTSNSATNGGAIYSVGGALNVLEGSEFVENSAKFGGAYYGASDASFVGVSFLNNSAFSEDFDGTGYSGGAIYNASSSKYASKVTIDGSSFEQNRASKYGGAISNFGTLRVSNAMFMKNEASMGGAIQTVGTAIIGSSDFEDNLAFKYDDISFGTNDFGGNGGAIYASNNGSQAGSTSSVTITGETSFRSCSAENAGGAIDIVSGAATVDADGIVYFTNCSAAKRGGSVAVAGALTIDGTLNVSESSAAYGGALYLEGKGQFVNNGSATFEVNSADYGGALYIQTGDENAMKLGEATFDGNKASEGDDVYYASVIGSFVIHQADVGALGSTSVRFDVAVYGPVVTSWTINWGDGVEEKVADLADSIVASHMYAEGVGAQTIMLTVVYDDLGEETFTIGTYTPNDELASGAELDSDQLFADSELVDELFEN